MAEKWFLKLDGIPGGSTDARHRHEIDVESWSWGLTGAVTHGSGGGAGAGKASFEDLQIVAALSAASPKLFLACAAGTHVVEAVLSGLRPGPAPLQLLVLTLRDVVVSGYHVGDELLDVPKDRFSLAFGQVELRYTPQDAGGKAGSAVSAGWDVLQHQLL
ncbi:MAG TPA: type VI secretion system tube protein Hcp [Cellulomonas sp.]